MFDRPGSVIQRSGTIATPARFWIMFWIQSSLSLRAKSPGTKPSRCAALRNRCRNSHCRRGIPGGRPSDCVDRHIRPGGGSEFRIHQLAWFSLYRFPFARQTQRELENKRKSLRFTCTKLNATRRTGKFGSSLTDVHANRIHDPSTITQHLVSRITMSGRLKRIRRLRLIRLFQNRVGKLCRKSRPEPFPAFLSVRIDVAGNPGRK